MTDRLDARIRELYAELVAATPPVPQLPARAPVGKRRWRAWERVAVAMAVSLLALGTGGFLLSRVFVRGGGEDLAAETTRQATERTTTTAASATTAPGRPTTIDAACIRLRDRLEELELPPRTSPQRETVLRVLGDELGVMWELLMPPTDAATASALSHVDLVLLLVDNALAVDPELQAELYGDVVAELGDLSELLAALDEDACVGLAEGL